VSALGIDAEVNDPLPPGVLEDVLHGRERELRGHRDPVDLPRLVFSAKEAVYKAWFPLAGRWLGFEDVEVSIDLAGGGFRARLLVPGPVAAGRPITDFMGRWTHEDGIICTAVVVP
jgi:4'-phosphopantetheinyl transferase EntD